MSQVIYKIGVVVRDGKTKTTHHFEHLSSVDLTVENVLSDDEVMRKIGQLIPNKSHTANYGIEVLFVTD